MCAGFAAVSSGNSEAGGDEGGSANNMGPATLAYTAPEAVDGRRTEASDVYSFGVILWEVSPSPVESARVLLSC